MKEKEIYIVKVKLLFHNGEKEWIPFHVEADNSKQAERKLEEWLSSGRSSYNFKEILYIGKAKNIYVIC